MKIIKPKGKGPDVVEQRDSCLSAKTKQRNIDLTSEEGNDGRNQFNVKPSGSINYQESEFSATSLDKSNKAANEKSYKDLLHKAVHILSMREHSKLELFVKLNNKEANVDVVDKVMRFLSENDYVSDTRFTETFVRAKANKGQGPIKIRAQLKQKGVDEHTIQNHLDEQSDRWFDIAQAEYDKKYGELLVTDYNSWTKRARFLQGRGFTMDHIHCVVPRTDFD